jgi:predicted chitinase
MSQKLTKRLSRDTTYDKKKTTYQESLSKEEIQEKLEEYRPVEDISTVALNTHLRYFTINPKTGEKQFRLGGFLAKIDLEKGYVILNNNSLSWSVQLQNTAFFQKMSFKELKEEIMEEAMEIAKKKYGNPELIEKLTQENQELKHEIKKLKKVIKEIKNIKNK